MKRKFAWLVISCLMILSLVLASCATEPKPTPTLTPTQSPTLNPTPTPTPTPTPSPTSNSATTANGEPQYGGVIISSATTHTYFDTYRYERNSDMNLSLCYQRLDTGNWAVDRKVYDFAMSVGALPPEHQGGCLAESWEMPDPLTIIIHVRKGVKWQDKPPVNGREFTADDVVWNFERYIKDPFIDRQYILVIASAKALDKYTVELKIAPPRFQGLPTIVLNVVSLFFMPKESLDSTGEIRDWKKVVGTGAFILADYVPDSGLTFTKNPNYWGNDERHPDNRLPYADGAKILIIPDISTLLSALRTGKIDVYDKVSWQDANSLKITNSEMKIKGLDSTAYHFKVRTDKAPFTDIRVRQAMQMAVDLKEIAKTFYGGTTLIYRGPIEPFHTGVYIPYDELPDKPMFTNLSLKELLTYNTEKANKLLAEAGYPNGFKTNCIATRVRAPDLPELFQSYMKAVGIDVEIKYYESAVYDSLRAGKSHDQILLH